MPKIVEYVVSLQQGDGSFFGDEWGKEKNVYFSVVSYLLKKYKNIFVQEKLIHVLTFAP